VKSPFTSCNEGALKSASTSSFHSYATFVEKQGPGPSCKVIPTHDGFTRKALGGQGLVIVAF